MTTGIDAGDLPGWIGALAGVGALAWQAWTQWSASTSKRTSAIRVLPGLTGDDVLVSVEWLQSEPHTAYEASIRLRSPTTASITAVEEYYDFSADNFVFTPSAKWRPGGPASRSLRIRMDNQDAGSPTARFAVVGLDQPMTPFRVKIAIHDLASGQVVARRSLPVSWSMV